MKFKYHWQAALCLGQSPHRATRRGPEDKERSFCIQVSNSSFLTNLSLHNQHQRGQQKTGSKKSLMASKSSKPCSRDTQSSSDRTGARTLLQTRTSTRSMARSNDNSLRISINPSLRRATLEACRLHLNLQLCRVG